MILEKGIWPQLLSLSKIITTLPCSVKGYNEGTKIFNVETCTWTLIIPSLIHDNMNIQQK